ncbi:Gfo/Idh/MocA family oxidoreductase [Candidatus Woesearchaeota archaeon]|nr:Gfo/Idh/MocA family oxidoreductase [Candidatus Woesearchaeota archaeon]
MKKLRVAVIGAGAMGKSHARVYSELENADLVAVCDSDKKTADEIAAKYAVKAYYNYRKLLSSEKLDAVSICVPTKFHREVAVEAAARKVNMLVEKPIAPSMEDAEAIIEASKKANVKLMVGHIERFNPVIIELKKRIQNGELGKIYKVHCVRLSPFPQRIVDVGVIVDFAIHDIDVLRHIAGSKIKRVYAETAQRIHSAHEDLLIGTMRFENGTLGVLNTNWLTPKKVREITVTGEKGMFAANYITQEMNFFENEFTRQNLGYNGNFMNVIEGKASEVEIAKKEPLKNELEAFLECIRENKPSPISGEEGMRTLEIAQKFLESAKKHEVVEP